MSWNLIRHEWFMNRRSWWIGGAVILLFQSMFAGLGDMYITNPDILDLMKTMPSGLMEGFGMDLEMMTTFEGWMGGEPQTFYVLLLGAFAAIWAAGTVSRERDQQSSEFLFSLPYRRGTIFVSKAFAHWVQMTVIFAVSTALILALGWATTTVDHPGTIVALCTAGYLIALAFAGIGYILTTYLRSERAAMSLGIGIVLLMFLLNMLSGMDDSISWMAGLSLFHAFDTREIVLDRLLSSGGIVVCLVLYAGGLATGLFSLKRQDI